MLQDHLRKGAGLTWGAPGDPPSLKRPPLNLSPVLGIHLLFCLRKLLVGCGTHLKSTSQYFCQWGHADPERGGWLPRASPRVGGQA